MPCSRTQHGLTRVGLEPLTSGSGVRGLPRESRLIYKKPAFCICENNNNNNNYNNNNNNNNNNDFILRGLHD